LLPFQPQKAMFQSTYDDSVLLNVADVRFGVYVQMKLPLTVTLVQPEQIEQAVRKIVEEVKREVKSHP